MDDLHFKLRGDLIPCCKLSRGMYVCRTLSYNGAEIEVVEVPLEAKMMVLCIFQQN